MSRLALFLLLICLSLPSFADGGHGHKKEELVEKIKIGGFTAAKITEPETVTVQNGITVVKASAGADAKGLSGSVTLVFSADAPLTKGAVYDVLIFGNKNPVTMDFEGTYVNKKNTVTKVATGEATTLKGKVKILDVVDKTVTVSVSTKVSDPDLQITNDDVGLSIALGQGIKFPVKAKFKFDMP